MEPLDELAGESPGISGLRQHVRRLHVKIVSGRRLPALLILGETGTGKGLLARAIHRAGPRPSGPFISVNCAAIPEPLFESELFGVERGAFTDARHTKPGLLQAAHQGTLFLDEVGLLPESTQAKLLTVLDDRLVRRLGSTRADAIDVWIIAATSVDLEAAVRERRFREDLYHRLSGVPLRLPPLRERGSDIGLLAQRFLSNACSDYALPQKTLAADALGALRTHRWPGNVRELSNVMERVALLTDADVIVAESLALPAHASALITPAVEPEVSTGFRRSLERTERLQIQETLRRTHWNISHAAEELGIPRNTLRYRMVKLGLEPNESSTQRRRSNVTQRSSRPGATDVSPASCAEEARTITFLRCRFGPMDSPAAERSPILALFVGKIEAFGGVVVDGRALCLDAAFGIEPVEDTASRAANAALAIRRLTERAQAERPDVTVTIAMHSVRCLVRQANGVTEVEPEAMREIESTLATLLDGADDAMIVVSPSTAPLLERKFALEHADDAHSSRDLARISGRIGLALPSPPSRPAPALQPVASADTLKFLDREPTGFGLGSYRLSPFVGRDREMVGLADLLYHSAAGRGHAVAVLGEPGVGKSRLLYEFRHSLGDSVVCLEGWCFSHGSGVPYLPLADLLRRAWKLGETDDPGTITATVRERIASLGLASDSLAAYLLLLLGARPACDDLAQLSPEAIKTHIFRAVREILVAHSLSQPLVVMLEDLHWLDRASEEFLAGFIDALVGERILLVATYRPGYQPPWLGHSHASQLTLVPLSDDASRIVVRSVQPEQVPAPLEREILRRGEGNPFFLEELAWTALQLGQRGTVPATVEAALTARIDRLPPSARRALEAAAVLGREVPDWLLPVVCPDTELAAVLGELVRLEFLYPRPGLGHVFKHALTQDVAYNRLSLADRQRLHVAAGRAFEEHYADRLEEVYDRLAHHYSRTTDTLKAVEYLIAFGQQATARYALPEAVDALDQARTLSEQLASEQQREARVLDAIVRASLPLVLLGRLQQAQDLLLRHVDRLDQLNNSTIAGPYYLWLAATYDHMGDWVHAEEAGARSLDHAHRCADESTIGMAYTILAHTSQWAGRFREGVERCRQALDHLRRPADGFFRGLALDIEVYHHLALGEHALALEAAVATQALGEQIGDRRYQSYGACMVGWVFTRLGDPLRGMAACQRAVELAPDPLAMAIVLDVLGEACLAADDPSRAQRELTRAVELLRRFHFRVLEAWGLARLADAALANGDVRSAREAAREALLVAEAGRFPLQAALAQRALGRVAQVEGTLTAAFDLLGRATEAFDGIEARYDGAVARLDLVAVAHALGDRRAAERYLHQAVERFTAMGLAHLVRRATQVGEDLGLSPVDFPATGTGDNTA
jgi:DNA-binding NtrC family response regulator/tetratricopeptide (TPR) repeat protein